MGRRNKGRNVSGIVLLDKPLGITSNIALQKVKRLFNAAKAGHTGSLDPMATGLLPLCLGEATKISGYLLNADKSYRGTIKLGVRTSSADAEGEVIETRLLENISEKRILDAFNYFTGDILQIPPMHSALKVNGQPLYKLAHQGKEIERQPRQVTIYNIALLHFESDEIDFRVDCSKGTYIRTLAEDIGEKLECGAYLSALHRTVTGPFEIDHALSFAQLENLFIEDNFSKLDAVLTPAEEALVGWQTVNMSNNAAYYVCQGQAVMVPKAPTSGLVRLFAPEKGFIGVGEILSDGRVAPRRLLHVDNNE